MLLLPRDLLGNRHSPRMRQGSGRSSLIRQCSLDQGCESDDGDSDPTHHKPDCDGRADTKPVLTARAGRPRLSDTQASTGTMDRLEKVRAKNRRAQAAYRERRKEAEKGLEDKKANLMASLQECQAARTNKQAALQQAHARITCVSAELQQLRDQYHVSDLDNQSPNATHVSLSDLDLSAHAGLFGSIAALLSSLDDSQKANVVLHMHSIPGGERLIKLAPLPPDAMREFYFTTLHSAVNSICVNMRLANVRAAQETRSQDAQAPGAAADLTNAAGGQELPPQAALGLVAEMLPSHRGSLACWIKDEGERGCTANALNAFRRGCAASWPCAPVSEQGAPARLPSMYTLTSVLMPHLRHLRAQDLWELSRRLQMMHDKLDADEQDHALAAPAAELRNDVKLAQEFCTNMLDMPAESRRCFDCTPLECMDDWQLKEEQSRLEMLADLIVQETVMRIALFSQLHPQKACKFLMPLYSVSKRPIHESEVANALMYQSLNLSHQQKEAMSREWREYRDKSATLRDAWQLAVAQLGETDASMQGLQGVFAAMQDTPQVPAADAIHGDIFDPFDDTDIHVPVEGTLRSAPELTCDADILLAGTNLLAEGVMSLRPEDEVMALGGLWGGAKAPHVGASQGDIEKGTVGSPAECEEDASIAELRRIYANDPAPHTVSASIGTAPQSLENSETPRARNALRDDHSAGKTAGPSDSAAAFLQPAQAYGSARTTQLTHGDELRRQPSAASAGGPTSGSLPLDGSLFTEAFGAMKSTLLRQDSIGSTPHEANMSKLMQMLLETEDNALAPSGHSPLQHEPLPLTSATFPQGWSLEAPIVPPPSPVGSPHARSCAAAPNKRQRVASNAALHLLVGALHWDAAAATNDTPASAEWNRSASSFLPETSCLKRGTTAPTNTNSQAYEEASRASSIANIGCNKRLVMPSTMPPTAPPNPAIPSALLATRSSAASSLPRVARPPSLRNAGSMSASQGQRMPLDEHLWQVRESLEALRSNLVQHSELYLRLMETMLLRIWTAPQALQYVAQTPPFCADRHRLAELCALDLRRQDMQRAAAGIGIHD